MIDRIAEIEMHIASQERTVDELSDEVFRLAKQVTEIEKQLKRIIDSLDKTEVKPLSEETPPPHY